MILKIEVYSFHIGYLFVVVIHNRIFALLQLHTHLWSFNQKVWKRYYSRRLGKCACSCRRFKLRIDRNPKGVGKRYISSVECILQFISFSKIWDINKESRSS